MTGTGGATRKVGIGRPNGRGPSGWIVIGPCPGAKTGICSVYRTVSIQNIADIETDCAFGLAAAGSPSRNAILSVPPPNSGGGGLVAIMSTVVETMLCPAI